MARGGRKYEDQRVTVVTMGEIDVEQQNRICATAYISQHLLSECSQLGLKILSMELS